MRLVLSEMDGVPPLPVCSLLYGSGAAIHGRPEPPDENLDFGRDPVTISDGKGQKDRVTMHLGAGKVGVSADPYSASQLLICFPPTRASPRIYQRKCSP
jgi:hypothetical protein